MPNSNERENYPAYEYYKRHNQRNVFEGVHLLGRFIMKVYLFLKQKLIVTAD